jgi:hypothetical protein
MGGVSVGDRLVPVAGHPGDRITGAVSWFDGRLLALGAVLYLLVSGFLELTRRYDERVGLRDDSEGESPT